MNLLLTADFGLTPSPSKWTNITPLSKGYVYWGVLCGIPHGQESKHMA